MSLLNPLQMCQNTHCKSDFFFCLLLFGFKVPSVLDYYTRDHYRGGLFSCSFFSFPPTSKELFFSVRSQKLPVLFFGFLPTTFKPLSGPEEESEEVLCRLAASFQSLPFPTGEINSS